MSSGSQVNSKELGVPEGSSLLTPDLFFSTWQNPIEIARSLRRPSAEVKFSRKAAKLAKEKLNKAEGIL